MSRCARRARSLRESFRALDSRSRARLAIREGYHERPGGVPSLAREHHSMRWSALAHNVVGIRETERLRRLQVDDEFEPGGLFDRQIGGLCALEDLVDEGAAWRYRSSIDSV
jgi:hypothetical protein